MLLHKPSMTMLHIYLYLLLLLFFTKSTYDIDPIIFIPGIAASQLEVKLTNSNPGHWYCRKNSDYYTLWVNVIEDTRFLNVNCFLYYMELFYNNKTKRFYNHPGVSFRGKDFGGYNGVKWIDESFHFVHYAYEFFEFMVNERGYEIGKNLRAATYDFRLFVNEYIETGWYESLKTLIENTYNINSKKKVHVVCHSMGAPIFNYFLTHLVDNDWKDKYINSFISAGGAWDGSFESSLYGIVTYQLPNWLEWDILGFSLQKYMALLAKPFSRMASIQYMIPTQTLQKEVYLFTDKRNYSMEDYHQILIDQDNEVAWEIFQLVNSEKYYKLTANNVKMHCVYTDNIPTVRHFYVDDLKKPVISKILLKTDGDGTLLLEVLALCDDFVNKQPHVNVWRIQDVKHHQIIKDKKFYKIVEKIVTRVK